MILRGFKATASCHSSLPCTRIPIPRFRPLPCWWSPRDAPRSNFGNTRVLPRAQEKREGFPLHASLWSTSIPPVVLLFGLCASLWLLNYTGGQDLDQEKSSPSLTAVDVCPIDSSSGPLSDLSYADMPIPLGHLGNLTPDQEIKLGQFWALALKTIGVRYPSSTATPVDTDTPTISALQQRDEVSKTPDKKKKRMLHFGGKKHEDTTDSPSSSRTSTPTSEEDDKYGQVKEFRHILATQTPEDLRHAFWSMIKADHPDALLLRFLRARKWDVDKALVMLVATMHWRSADMHLDDELMRRGEAGAVEDARSGDAARKKDGADFLTQLRLGTSYLHGVDKDGRPMCFVRVRLHKPGELSERSIERFTVYIIETARLTWRSPVETAVSAPRESSKCWPMLLESPG